MSSQLPDAVVQSERRGKVHRPANSGLAPACGDRLHNTDADWHLLADTQAEGERCQHPECFGGD